jgi:single-stranded DNA-binding protein
MKLDTDNNFSLTGTVVSVTRKNEIVHLRLFYKKNFKEGAEWLKDESYFTVSFWGKLADAVEDCLVPEMYVEIGGELNTWPKDGPESQIRLKGKGFNQIIRG